MSRMFCYGCDALTWTNCGSIQVNSGKQQLVLTQTCHENTCEPEVVTTYLKRNITCGKKAICAQRNLSPNAKSASVKAVFVQIKLQPEKKYLPGLGINRFTPVWTVEIISVHSFCRGRFVKRLKAGKSTAFSEKEKATRLQRIK